MKSYKDILVIADNGHELRVATEVFMKKLGDDRITDRSYDRGYHDSIDSIVLIDGAKVLFRTVEQEPMKFDGLRPDCIMDCTQKPMPPKFVADLDRMIEHGADLIRGEL
jgi:hypothetical protein